jgi:hypothetical protein
LRTPVTIHGRLPFETIEHLIERLKQVAAIFPEESDFTAYLTTRNSERYYGLNYAEVEQRFREHRGEVQTISTSITEPEGRSVRVNFRFSSKGSTDGQYIIATYSRFQSRQIEQMLRGTWVPPSKEQQALYDSIEVLVYWLKEVKEDEEKRIAEAAEEAALRKAKIEAKQKESQRQHLRQINIRDRFEFDKGVSTSIVIHLLEQLSQTFLNRAPFNIRLITTDGEPYSDIGVQGLQRFLDKRRAKVLRLYMDAATPEGELIDMALDLDPKNRRNRAEIEITSGRAKEIQAMIRHILENTVAYSTADATMIHEMFRFDDQQFQLDRVIHLLSAISTKYLQRATPTAFLSTNQGRTFPALSLRQLRAVYHQHEHEVSFLLFGMNQARTGQTFSLMFQFQAPGHEAYGSLSMMWSNHEMHQMVKQLIWTQLKLRPYRKGSPAVSQSSRTELRKKHMLVNPHFSNREFQSQPMSSLVIMPLEAYWSQPLWQQIRKLLSNLGYDSMQAEALFQENVLENTWTRMNEVDLVIADLTYKHPDVFYKLGVAHTLGKKVVLITQHSRDIPPDFRFFPTIVYDNNLPGLEKLNQQLIEIIRKL